MNTDDIKVKDSPDMDFVYVFKEDVENGSEELRYSLRSLRNVPHNRVVLVGEKPDWVDKVLFIPVPQSGTKHENVTANLAAVIRDNRISDDFVLMNDDFFIMKQMDKIPNLNFGPMDKVLALYDKRYPEGSNYIDNMRSLYELLRGRGYAQPISYELHTPMVINRYIVQKLHQELQGERMYQFRTYYGNYAALGGTAVEDVKVFIPSIHNSPAYNASPESYLKSQTFLSVTGTSFRQSAAGDFIRLTFPDKSSYES